MQQIVGRHFVVGAQMRRRRLEHVAARDGHLLREIGVVFEEHGRRHHLRDAGDRSLILRMLFPEHLVGFGVVNDRGRGAQIGDELSGRIHFVARQHGGRHLARRRDCARLGELALAGLRPRGGVGRRLPGRRVMRGRLDCRGVPRRLLSASRYETETDETAERNRTDPEIPCSVHQDSPNDFISGATEVSVADNL